MHKPHDWTQAARSPFGLLSDAWAEASRHPRAPAPAPQVLPTLRQPWRTLGGLFTHWFMPRH